MPVPRFSLVRLAEYLDKRFDGNVRKLAVRLQELAPDGNWAEFRVRRLVRGEQNFGPDDLGAFQVALNLDSINDLYEVN